MWSSRRRKELVEGAKQDQAVFFHLPFSLSLSFFFPWAKEISQITKKKRRGLSKRDVFSQHLRRKKKSYKTKTARTFDLSHCVQVAITTPLRLCFPLVRAHLSSGRNDDVFLGE